MKTINEAVENTSLDELKTIARIYYEKLEFELREEIREKQKDPKRMVGNYYIIKDTLERAGVFNPKYDGLFQKAVEGKLNLIKLRETFK
ncbi:MAG: hypothetical protein WC511_05310 [Candidatus Pacearchaeota archaeon]